MYGLYYCYHRNVHNEDDSLGASRRDTTWRMPKQSSPCSEQFHMNDGLSYSRPPQDFNGLSKSYARMRQIKAGQTSALLRWPVRCETEADQHW